VHYGVPLVCGDATAGRDETDWGLCCCSMVCNTVANMLNIAAVAPARQSFCHQSHPQSVSSLLSNFRVAMATCVWLIVVIIANAAMDSSEAIALLCMISLWKINFS